MNLLNKNFIQISPFANLDAKGGAKLEMTDTAKEVAVWGQFRVVCNMVECAVQYSAIS